MPKPIMLPTFDEFRRTNDESLRRQRELLRDDAVAEDVRRETSARSLLWMQWLEDEYAYEK